MSISRKDSSRLLVSLPSLFKAHACASCLSLASRRTNQPGRFKPPGRFIPSQFVCIDPVLSSRWLFRRLVYCVSRRLRSGCGGRIAGETSRRGKIDGKISVKCQFALNIWNFCEKGECGALAMILLNRLSRLGSPDVL